MDVRRVILYLFFGLSTFVVRAQVVINELYPTPAGDKAPNSLFNICVPGEKPREWVELYNTNLCDTIDLGCFVLASNTGIDVGLCTDDVAGLNGGAYIFPPGTRVPPGGFLVVGDGGVELNLLASTPYVSSSPRWFLSNTWGWIALYDPQGAPQNAVYWTAASGEIDALNTRPAFANALPIYHPCLGETLALAPARNMEGLIEYAGFTGQDFFVSPNKAQFYRQPDGGNAWKRFGPGAPTSGVCNGPCAQKPDLVSFQPKTASICAGESFTITPFFVSLLDTLFTYNWSSNPPNFTATTKNVTISPQTTTQYFLQTRRGLCLDIDTFSLKVYQRPINTVEISKDTVCTKENFTVKYSGASTASLVWDFGGANANPGTGVGPHTVSFLEAGLKTISLTISENGCKNDTTLTLTVLQTPETEFTFAPLKPCTGLPVTFQFTGSANADAQFYWTFPQGAPPEAQTLAPVPIVWAAPGVYAVALSVTNAGCPAEAVVKNVQVIDKFISLNVKDTTVCLGDTAFIRAVPIDSSAALTYLWTSIPAGFQSFAAEINVAPLADTRYVLKTQNAVCERFDTIIVRITAPGAPPVFETNKDTLCVGDTLQIFTETGTNMSYIWNWNGGTFYQTNNGFLAIWNEGGEKTLVLTRKTNGCLSPPFQKTIWVIPPPEATLSAPAVVCLNDTLRFSATSTNVENYLWRWKGQIREGSGPFSFAVENTGIDTLSLEISRAPGCSQTYKRPVETPLLNALIAAPDKLCVNERFSLKNIGTPGETYWEFMNEVAGTPDAYYYTSAGEKSVRLSVREKGCESAPVQKNISVFALPIPHLTGTPLVGFSPLKVDFETQGGFDKYAWRVDDGLPIYGDSTKSETFQRPGVYPVIVAVTDARGCTAEDTLKVRLVPPDVYIPNAFSPNDDKLNDLFEIFGFEKSYSFHLSIFNRWGLLIFQTEQPGNFWDGARAPEGVYTYLIEYEDQARRFNRLFGTITLIR